MQKKFIVAIDGPAGAGKSTVAKMLAQRLNYIYIDTGAMYRAVAWKAFEVYKNPTQEEVERVAAQVDIKFFIEKGINQVWVDGQEITEEIRTPQVTAGASKFSAYPLVRSVMSEKQREMGVNGGVVMDGRDIGTCIFPNARFKFFLTASVRVRAERRYADMVAKGYQGSLEELEQDMIARDRADSQRDLAPLAQAQDAILVDSSAWTADETVDKIYDICMGEKYAL